MDGTGLDERDLAEAEVKKKKKKDRLSKKKERSNSKSDPLGKNGGDDVKSHRRRTSRTASDAHDTAESASPSSTVPATSTDHTDNGIDAGHHQDKQQRKKRTKRRSREERASSLADNLGTDDQDRPGAPMENGIRQYEDGITSNGVEEHTESATLVDGGDGGPTVDEKGEQDFFDHDSPTEQGLDRKKSESTTDDGEVVTTKPSMNAEETVTGDNKSNQGADDVDKQEIPNSARSGSTGERQEASDIQRFSRSFQSSAAADANLNLDPAESEMDMHGSRVREMGHMDAVRPQTSVQGRKESTFAGDEPAHAGSWHEDSHVNEKPSTTAIEKRIARSCDEENNHDTGTDAASEAEPSPTPPRTRSNPINTATPPRRGSRGGNLAISTLAPTGARSKMEVETGRSSPTSPRSRPRAQPLVRIKSSAGEGHSGAGDEADRDGSGEGGDEEAARLVGFTTKGRMANEEYVLDESRETPRGGVFAKIPGLDQRLFVEARRINEPPKFSPPNLLAGTVRRYDAEEACNAAVRYPECRGAVYKPSYADDGSFENLKPTSPLLSAPPNTLRLERVHGYHGSGFYPSTDTNAYFLGENVEPNGGGKRKREATTSSSSTTNRERRDGRSDINEAARTFEVVYPTAALVVMQTFEIGTGQAHAFLCRGRKVQRQGGTGAVAWEEATTQRFFDGHSDDVTAIAVHPNGRVVASGQVGRKARVLVWDSRTRRGKGNHLARDAIASNLVGHERKICCLDFSHDGWLLCSVGADGKSTTLVWDWKKGDIIAKVLAGPGPINAFRFNPFQAYGVPSEDPMAGQAPHIDDACYCLASIGVRHSKFWLLTRGREKPRSEDEMAAALPIPNGPPHQGISQVGELTWLMDGGSARLNGKGQSADFTCMTFIDDSFPLQTWGAAKTIVDNDDEPDRTSGRVVMGTAAGDIYVFIQRGVRLIPRRFAEDVKRGKGGRGIFLDPWWLLGPGHEVTANKRLWDLGGELVENIPHSLEVARKLMLTGKAKERLHILEKQLAVRSLHPAVSEDLKRQHARMQYEGCLTGHEGGVTALAFNRRSGKVVSAGASGRCVQWQAFFSSSAAGDSSSCEGGSVVNSSVVGFVNACRNRKEMAFQENNRNPSAPRLRRVGDEPPTGDGRHGGVDPFEIDYDTTLAREDHGEIVWSELTPRRSETEQQGTVGGARNHASDPSETRSGIHTGRDGGPFDQSVVSNGEGLPQEGSLTLPRGSHCKSLAWSKDGTQLLAGFSTNALLTIQYPRDDRDASSEHRAETASPKIGARRDNSDPDAAVEVGAVEEITKVRCLVQGHHGSVTALAVFEGLGEYVTAGYDRSAVLWNTSSHLPVGWCPLPTAASCLACSPNSIDVVVGTPNSNEILILRVEREGKGRPSERRPSGASGTGRATGLSLCAIKQLLPASALVKRWQPNPHAPGVFSGSACGKVSHAPFPTLDGRDTTQDAGVASGNNTREGQRTPSFQSPTSLKASPGRCRARSVTEGVGPLTLATTSGNDGCHLSDEHLPQHTPPRQKSSKASLEASSPRKCAGYQRGRFGERDGGTCGKELQRGLGASCMRYSPAGSHLAVGCKNGSLVIMEVSLDKVGGRDVKGTQGDVVSNTRSTGWWDGSSQIPRMDVEGLSGLAHDTIGGAIWEGHIQDTSRQQHPLTQVDSSVPRTSYRRIAHLKGHSSRVLHLDWTMDGRFLHTCGQDYQLLHWEILPAPKTNEMPEKAIHETVGDRTGVARFRPRLSQRAFLLRDATWATWTSTVGWPVQGIFPAYSDNTEVNAVDVCHGQNVIATADDAKTVRLLRYPALRGGAKARAFTAHSSHVMSARFIVCVGETMLITIGGLDSTVMRWVMEDDL